jgi:endonuclease/exonuclease/phosphatase family metal-dependent hydrolase
MSRLFFKISLLFVLLIVFSIQGSTGPEQKHQVQSNRAPEKIVESSPNLSLNPDFGNIPLYFIPNEGQVDERALFYAKTSRYTLWLTKEGLVFDSTRRTKKESTNSKKLSPEDINNHEDYKYDRDVSRLIFIDANRSPEVIPLDVTEHKVNYFIGKDRTKWRTNIQTSKAVLYRELYPNIGLKVYGIEKQIEYDFVVKPGGEVSDICFEYKHVEKTRIDKDGNLVVKTEFGELEHAKPICYQVIEGKRVKVEAEFKKADNNTYGFEVEDYNKNYELIIDPLVLFYSTYLGGSDRDGGHGIAVDSEGAVYVTGDTESVDFPTQNPIQGSIGGGDYDAFITKINASGTALIYSTYLGGSGWDRCVGIAVDSKGAAYVTGHTRSVNFPTKNPIQGSHRGGDQDAFITKINASGTALIYSTYLGGSGDEGGLYRGISIAVDSEGAAYVTGRTESLDFPTQNPIQGTNAGGSDVFISKINASGRALIYSTYLGGSNRDGGDGIAVDSKGAAYVTGEADSNDFPIQNPIQGSIGGGSDAFITKVNASGRALILSTYLGGSGGDVGLGIAVDSEGAAYVTGWTGSVDFPTKNPIQGSLGGENDVFITKIAEGIRIVSWNILDYPDMNQEPREEYFRSLLEILDPDILVVQEIASAASVSQFLKEILNHKPPRLYKAAKFFDGPDTDNSLFYKKALFKLVSRQQIPTLFRDITEYKMKIKKGAGKGTKFKVYSVHLSEGAGANKKRENEALTLRTYLDGLLPDELFLVCGSFNMLSSTEKAFKILTGNQVNNNGRLMDPIHKMGKWHDKSKHRRFHTESTRKSKFGGGTGEGLDDRYDMILISYGLEENEQLIYSEGNCSVFGNDGKHLNKAINKPKNKAVSPDIADALYQASDHLPVIIDLKPYEKE